MNLDHPNFQGAYRRAMLAQCRKEKHTPKNKPRIPPDQEETRARIIAYIRRSPGCSAADISDALNVSLTCINNYARTLVEWGKVRRFRVAANEPYEYEVAE